MKNYSTAHKQDFVIQWCNNNNYTLIIRQVGGAYAGLESFRHRQLHNIPKFLGIETDQKAPQRQSGGTRGSAR
jgi:hypothetical protein